LLSISPNVLETWMRVSYRKTSRLDSPGSKEAVLAFFGNPVDLEEILLVCCVVDLGLLRDFIVADPGMKTKLPIQLATGLQDSLHLAEKLRLVIIRADLQLAAFLPRQDGSRVAGVNKHQLVIWS
jgi:hypothetical protein